MPKKTDPPESQEAQSKRFLEAARAIEADGGLSPTEAYEAVDRLVKNSVKTGLPKSRLTDRDERHR